MSTDTAGWTFGATDEDYPEPGQDGIRWLNLTGSPKAAAGTKDRAATWLRCAMIALGLLAVIAAAVSYSAQYQLVYSFKHLTPIAALQAGIPDAGALVFAALGISQALQGRRALRCRALNVLCVGISIAMNYLAASAGWRAAAVWTMAPVLYALASDTLIGVIRAQEIRRQRLLNAGLADDEATPLDVLGGALLWLLRLVLDPKGTLGGFRGWVLHSCPVAPGTRAALAAHPNVATLTAAPDTPVSVATATPRRRAHKRSAPGKGARLIEAYEALNGTDPRYGDRSKASQVARELAPTIGMQWGSARGTLYRHLDAQAGA